MVKGVYLFLLQAVDFIDVVLHDLQHAGVAEPMQTETGYGGKAAPDFMGAAGARVKAINAMVNGPLDGRIVAGIKMQ